MKYLVTCGLLQSIFSIFAIALLAFPVCSQTYSWKQVAPFPYFRAEHIIKDNNTYIAYGRTIDSIDESTGNKIELGNNPFFIISSDANTWKQISPKAIYPASGTGAAREEKIIPLKTMFLNDVFISIAVNGKNKKEIFLSENGINWHPAGIEASSLNFIRGRLIVENDLTFSVSFDGKKWDTYGTVFPDNPERHKKISKECQTVSIIADDPSTVSFNGDSTLGYYTDSSYVLTDNDRTAAISCDGKHWRVVERPVFRNDTLIENVVGYVYGNKRFVYVISSDTATGFSFSSTDGKNWEKRMNDTSDLSEEYGTYSPATKYERLFFRDSLFFITRRLDIENPENEGLAPVLIQYVSKDGINWKKNNNSNLQEEYPVEKLPGEWKPKKSSNLNGVFRLNSDGTTVVAVLNALAPLIFHDGEFIVPVEPNKTYYFSRDGYIWNCKKQNVEASLFYESHPYYNKHHTFVELRQKERSLESDSCSNSSRKKSSKLSDDIDLSHVITPFIVISKDRKLWDTVFIDTLLKDRVTCADRRDYSLGPPLYLDEFSDGLRLQLATQKGAMWFSPDGRRWSLLIVNTKLDSCHAYAKLNAAGEERKLYIFPNGKSKMSDNTGNRWYMVTDSCQDALTVCWGNGRFVAAGQGGKIWVLEEK